MFGLFAAETTDGTYGIGGAIAALTPLVIWFGRKLLSQVGQIPDRLAAVEAKLDSLHERVQSVEPVAEFVKAELSPNGGQSISDRVDAIQTQMLIVEARQRTRWAADGLATYECDAEGHCVWVSQPAADLYGMRPEDMLGSGWLAAIPTAAERQRVWDAWRAAVREGIPYEDTYPIRSRDGGPPVQVRTYTLACHDAAGRVVRYFGVVTRADAPPPPAAQTPSTD